ncbi:DUF397 domain-containing protein [Actinomadura flavalba]|uniref:DUF397 domain-containing protein n=1 Tax=Actinomadura flavalba TaxID=1120938 RepID=UPI0004769CF6|nr:DUF397 domain-containing protein [Actinomadura flavalba]
MNNLKWRKSSHSDPQGNNCIELASAPGTIAVRDSKNPEGPKLLVNRNDFRRFTETLQAL